MRKKLQKISKYRPSILQGKIDFAGVPCGFSFTVEHPAEQRVFRILCVLLGALLFCYLYFVSSSILNIMARKEASTSIAQIQSTIASLESQYFTLGKGVTEASASSLGLSPVKDTQYVYVPGNAASAGVVPAQAI
jgi:hypothetical protein